MKCLFIESGNINNSIIKIRGENFHHIHNVFRLKENEEIEIKDQVYAYRCSLITYFKDYADFKILDKRELVLRKLNITLCQSITKSDSFHLILQKATELGVSKIIPFISERSVVKIKENDQENKVGRWTKICESAAKQSGQDFIPDVTPLLYKISDLQINTPNKLIAYELESSFTLKNQLDQINPQKEIFIFIGPEGGFTQNELEIAKNFNFMPCSLGDHVLRSETATLYILSCLKYHFS